MPSQRPRRRRPTPLAGFATRWALQRERRRARPDDALATSGSQTTSTFFALALLLALLEIGARYVPNTWINRDGRFYTNANVTLTESLSLDQGEFCASWYDGEQGWNHHLDASWSNVAVGRDGRRVPKHPVLLPVLSTPLFWAFGHHGTLLFNILAFALAATAVFLISRRFASSSAATLAALAFTFGTGVRDYAYDYHVDVLLLAFFASGVAALLARRGWLAGLLVGGAVVLKPTTLMWLPALAVLVSTKDRWPALWRALLSGGLVLIGLAVFNWAVFGKPWWAGYNRVLVVVAGEPQVLDVGSAFDVPFDRGLETLWKGPLGVRSRLAIMLAGLPGLLLMVRRHPRYVVATLLALGAAVAVFARYQWYGDRFLWPAFALLAPALAVGLEWVGRGLRQLFRRRPVFRPAIAACVGAMLFVGAGFATTGDLHARVHPSATTMGATALAHGHLDLRQQFRDAELEPRMQGQESMVALTVRDEWVARASPVVTVLAAPFARGGPLGFALLRVLLAGLLALGCARLAERVSPGPVALAAPLVLLLAPGIRDRIMDGGPELFTAVFAVNALALAAYGRWLSAGVVSALATWSALAPIPIPLAVLALAPRGRHLTDAVAGIAVVALSAMGLATWQFGSPLQTAHDAVLIAGGVQGVMIDGPSLRATWEVLGEGAGLAWAGLVVVGVLGARRSRFVMLGVLCVLAVLWPTARMTSPVPLFALALASLGWPAFVRGLGTRLEGWSELTPARRIRIFSIATITLFTIGAVTRVEAAGAPLRFATDRGLREADVFLGDVPCDFLNWQHMNWECTTKDHGTENMVGLQVTDGVVVGGERRELMRIPNTGRWNRRVVWPDLRASERLRIRWAVPDDAEGGGTLVVRIGGEEIERLDLPEEPDGRIHARSFSSGDREGRAVAVELELEGRDAVVAVDGGFLE